MNFLRRLAPLQTIVHLYAWLPFAWLLVQALTNPLSENFIQELERQVGRHALALLALALSCTPLNSIFKILELIKHRRTLGLYALFYATIHMMLFVNLDNGLAWSRLPQTLSEKPYVLVGATALLILALMGATSFDIWKIRLGKNWKRLHQAVYFAAPLVILHFFWSQKLNALDSFSDALRLWIYGIIVAVLLILRIPVVKRAAAAFVSRYLMSRLKKSPPPKTDAF